MFVITLGSHLKPRANALDLSTVQALNMLSSKSWAHLNILLRGVERGHPCVAQQSRVHLHSNAQRFKPMHAQCLAYPRIFSHYSAWAFVKSSDCSTCWVIVEVIWTPRSTTPQQTLESLYSGQIQCICTQPNLTIRLRARVFYKQIVNEAQPSWLSLVENEGE